MMSNAKEFKTSLMSGMTQKVDEENSPLPFGKTSSNPLSPKERWEKKEKELKTKGLILIFFSNLFWFVVFTFPSLEDSDQTQTYQAIAKDHEQIKLPAILFASLPQKGQKAPVSIFREGAERILEGYLRGLEQDPLGMSGIKVIVEVHQKDLSYIKETGGTWNVFPPMNKELNPGQRKIHEISF